MIYAIKYKEEVTRVCYISANSEKDAQRKFENGETPIETITEESEIPEVIDLYKVGY